MSELISGCLKEVSTNLNLLQMRKKEYIVKFDFDSKKRLLDNMKDLLSKIKNSFMLIDQELDCSTGKVRSEFKSAVEANRLEYKKMIKEIDKFDNQIKNDSLVYKSKTIYDQRENIPERMINNTNNLKAGATMANEIVDRDKLTAEELRRQGNQLQGIHDTMDTVEHNLTLVQQITAVMKRNDLKYKIKLYFIVILLFIADFIVLYIKLR